MVGFLLMSSRVGSLINNVLSPSFQIDLVGLGCVAFPNHAWLSVTLNKSANRDFLIFPSVNLPLGNLIGLISLFGVTHIFLWGNTIGLNSLKKFLIDEDHFGWLGFGGLGFGFQLDGFFSDGGGGLGGGGGGEDPPERLGEDGGGDGGLEGGEQGPPDGHLQNGRKASTQGIVLVLLVDGVDLGLEPAHDQAALDGFPGQGSEKQADGKVMMMMAPPQLPTRPWSHTRKRSNTRAMMLKKPRFTRLLRWWVPPAALASTSRSLGPR